MVTDKEALECAKKLKEYIDAECEKHIGCDTCFADCEFRCCCVGEAVELFISNRENMINRQRDLEELADLAITGVELVVLGLDEEEDV